VVLLDPVQEPVQVKVVNVRSLGVTEWTIDFGRGGHRKCMAPRGCQAFATNMVTVQRSPWQYASYCLCDMCTERVKKASDAVNR
jgi:hypothetical protein